MMKCCYKQLEKILLSSGHNSSRVSTLLDINHIDDQKYQNKIQWALHLVECQIVTPTSRLSSMNDGTFRTQIPETYLQRDYFLHFNFNHWMHKAKALLNYIDGLADISGLRFEGDRDSEETIVNGLKMELHVMVFHRRKLYS